MTTTKSFSLICRDDGGDGFTRGSSALVVVVDVRRGKLRISGSGSCSSRPVSTIRWVSCSVCVTKRCNGRGDTLTKEHAAWARVIYPSPPPRTLAYLISDPPGARARRQASERAIGDARGGRHAVSLRITCCHGRRDGHARRGLAPRLSRDSASGHSRVSTVWHSRGVSQDAQIRIACDVRFNARIGSRDTTTLCATVVYLAHTDQDTCKGDASACYKTVLSICRSSIQLKVKSHRGRYRDASVVYTSPDIQPLYSLPSSA